MLGTPEPQKYLSLEAISASQSWHSLLCLNNPDATPTAKEWLLVQYYHHNLNHRSPSTALARDVAETMLQK